MNSLNNTNNVSPDTIILGVDPGSHFTGYGIIWERGAEQGCIVHGRIRLTQKNLPDRLLQIYEQLSDIIKTYQPQEMSIEQVFFHANAQSALKLGQARAAALLAAASQSIPITEYSAKQVKKAVVGYGAASKMQIQQMITSILKLKEKPDTDAADALAIALCHCNTRRLTPKLANMARKIRETA